MDTNYFVDEGDRNVTLTILVRGGANQCNKTEWALKYTIRNISAQCEHSHETCTWMEYFIDTNNTNIIYMYSFEGL